MDNKKLTPGRVLELKAEAHQMKRELNIKHTAALAQIAKREGFRSWEELLGRVGGADAIREAKLEAKHETVPTEAQVRRAERHADRLRRYAGSM